MEQSPLALDWVDHLGQLFTTIVSGLWLSITERGATLALFTRRAGLLWLRAILHTLGLITTYAALPYIQLSEVVTIFYLRPLPVVLLCWWYLGEKVSRIQIFTGSET